MPPGSPTFPVEAKFGNEKYGDIGNRIGNEIMINARDIA